MQRQYTNFNTFISKLLQDCDNGANISTDSKEILSDLIKQLCNKYCNAAVLLCKHAKKITIDADAIETLTKIWIPHNNDIIDYANNTLLQYSENTAKGLKRHTKAGLFLPPCRIKTILQGFLLQNQKIGELSYIYLTSIIEYIIRQILIKALLNAQPKITVTSCFLYNALNSNTLAEFRPLFKNIFIAGFGMIGDDISIN